MKNLAREFLEATDTDIEEYEGYCLELVDDVLHTLTPEQEKRAEIMYMDVPGLGDLLPSIPGPAWRHHAVLFIDGLVHDAHFVEAMPVAEYLRTMFPFNEEIEVTYNAGSDNERVERWLNSRLNKG